MISLDDCRYMQYVAALVASASISCTAMNWSWPSPTLPLLTSDDSPIGYELSNEQGSWLISLSLLATIPMTPITIIAVERLGRRKTLLCSSIFCFAAWILIIFATSVWELYLSRFISGMSFVLVTTSLTIYNSEIADKDIRGRLGLYIILMNLVGSFLVLSIGPFVSYTVLASICATAPVIFATVFFFMPETPYYLVKKGRKDEAIAVLKRLTSKSTTDEEITRRVSEMEAVSEEEARNKIGVWRFFKEKTYRKVIIITLGVKTLQQMCGSVAIEPYLQSIILATGSAISPEVSSIIFGATQIPAALLSSTIIDKVGRKPIIITSALACALALTSEGVYFFLQDYTKADVTYLDWLPTTGIVLFLTASTMGVLSVPYILVGELFPTNVRGIAVTSAMCYGSFLSFLVSKLFEPIKSAWGAYTMFWIYAGSCISGAVFVYVFLPETKGKTFEEIQEKLNRRRKNTTKIEFETI